MQDVFPQYSGSYGIIPKASGDTLMPVDGQTPLGLAALQSTSPYNWKKHNAHYCCQCTPHAAVLHCTSTMPGFSRLLHCSWIVVHTLWQSFGLS